MEAVTVLGAGAIGAAVARVLINAGHSVTVWNRSVERTRQLEEIGAHVSTTVHEAVAVSDITIVCLSTTVVSALVLGEDRTAAALFGKTVLQVTSATIGDTRAEAAWAEAHNIDYLKGFMLSFPRGMGTDFGLIFVAGRKPVLDRHRTTLEHVAQIQYVGQDPALVCVYGTASIWIHYASMYGLLYASAYAEANGVALSDVFNAADGAVWRFAEEALIDQSRRIRDREFSGDEATISTHLAAFEHALDLPGISSAGIDPGFAPALKRLMQDAVRAGDGERDFSALASHIRRQSSFSKPAL